MGRRRWRSGTPLPEPVSQKTCLGPRCSPDFEVKGGERCRSKTPCFLGKSGVFVFSGDAVGRLVLVIGGARSGKSGFALRLARRWGGPLVFVATARDTDAEMAERIARHRRDRGPEWETLEEPLAVARLLGSLEREGGVVVVDCITLLVSNLMVEKGYGPPEVEEEMVRVVEAARAARFGVIAVTNEVGLGVVPEPGLARRFRDAAGTANQRLARAADQVFWMAAGIPVRIKGEEG